MRRFVDGVEIEFPDGEATVEPFEDRLIVRSARGTKTAVAIRDADAVLVSYLGRQYRVERRPPRASSTGGASSGEMRAPMPGQVVDVRVALGDVVSKGSVILVLEAMKTQQPFAAPFDGIVKRLNVARGAQVDEGTLLALVEPA